MPDTGHRGRAIVSSLLNEFFVFLSKDEALEGLILGVGRFELLFESGFVGGDLLRREGKDSSAGLCEFGLTRELFGREGFGTRVADTPCTKGLTTFLEVGVGMGTDLPSVVVHHVNRFVLCHS